MNLAAFEFHVFFLKIVILGNADRFEMIIVTNMKL